MKRISPAVACALLVAAVPALAATDGAYRGRTSQGVKVFVKVRNGEVQRVNVPWSTTTCTPRDGYKLTFRRYLYTNTTADPIDQSGSRFSDGGRNTVRIGNGGKATLDAFMTGRFSGHRVKGRQVISVRARDRFGRHTCTSRVRWSAKLVR